MCPPDDKPVLLVALDGTVVVLNQSAAVKRITLPPGELVTFGRKHILPNIPAGAQESLSGSLSRVGGFFAPAEEADTPVTIGPSAMTAGSETGRALRPAEPRPAE